MKYAQGLNSNTASEGVRFENGTAKIVPSFLGSNDLTDDESVTLEKEYMSVILTALVLNVVMLTMIFNVFNQ